MRISTVVVFLTVPLAVWLVQAQETGSGTDNKDGKKAKAVSDFVCPPIDRDGTTLEATNNRTSFLTCIYRAAGTCMYDLSDGLISPNLSTTCPPSAAQDLISSSAIPNTSTSRSNSASVQSNSAVSSASSTEEASSQMYSSNLTGERDREQCDFSAFWICYSNEAREANTSTDNRCDLRCSGQRRRRLTIALILWAKHRRRAAKKEATAIEHDANTVSPFTLITQMDGPNDEATPPRDADLCDVSPSTVARQHLETELREVHEKMADLQDQERSSTRAATGSGMRGVLRLMSMPSTATRGLPDVEAQLEASREQINMLVTRMQALEANTNSAYGAGFSNEPPPAYV
ncbi:hypothetical protein B0H13DRAFT_1869464 [Mycena leptocephala]|nr:hypothetical protein B0H13DRAFT_1869464 [Mycena leptocephala]